MGAEDTNAAAPVVESAPAVDTGTADTSSASIETPAPESTPEVTPDDFGWDSWDGSDDALPEPVRPWASKLSAHHMKQAQAARDEAERIRKVYESLVDGQEHPELTELRAKYETESKTWQERQAELEKTKSDYAAYQKAVADWQDKILQEKVDDFQRKNAWMFESEELQELGGKLIDEGFDPYTDLPILLRMPDQVLERARKEMAELAGAKNAGPKAIQIAQAAVRLPAPNQSADLVNGADARISNKITDPAEAEDASLEDLANSSLRKHLRAVR